MPLFNIAVFVRLASLGLLSMYAVMAIGTSEWNHLEPVS